MVLMSNCGYNHVFEVVIDGIMERWLRLESLGINIVRRIGGVI